MPELPEVETIRQRLREGGPDSPSIVGREVLGAELQWMRTLATPAPEEFMVRVVGQTIEDVGRRGKFLLLHLSHDTLIMHLRMSGDIFITPFDDPPEMHDRLVLFLSGGIRLAFNDPRKFGRAWLVANSEEVLGGLGPEPLSDSFSAASLYDRLQASRRQLKPLLLDQTFLAGLGNIYTDEALYRSGLHPLALSHWLSPQDAERLWESIRAVLVEGIQRHGASIDWVYRGGDFQNYFRVYRRTGLPCPACGTPIVRILVGQRSTHLCPHCQPQPGR